MTAKTTSNKPSQKNARQPTAKKNGKADAKTTAVVPAKDVKPATTNNTPDLSLTIKGRPTKERNAITHDDVLTYLGNASPSDRVACEKAKDGAIFTPFFVLTNGRDNIAYTVNLSHQVVYHQNKKGDASLRSTIGITVPKDDIEHVVRVIATSKKWADEHQAIKDLCHLPKTASIVGDAHATSVIKGVLVKLALDKVGTFRAKVGCDVVFALNAHFQTDRDYVDACLLADKIKSKGAQLSNVAVLPSA